VDGAYRSENGCKIIEADTGRYTAETQEKWLYVYYVYKTLLKHGRSALESTYKPARGRLAQHEGRKELLGPSHLHQYRPAPLK
jgi:hypothetical protein